MPFPILVIGLFVFAALASSSSKEVMSDPGFREGFERGWEFGSSLTSEALPEMLETDSIAKNAMSEIAYR